MNKKAIPVIFAVTGHRDIHSDAISQIRKIIKDRFESFQNNYPHTPAILISALAEGADMLVAEVAIECGIELHVMFPYEEKAYLNSFKNSDNIQIFKKLKSKASRIEVLSDKNLSSSEELYEILGKKLADISTILIALWDGKDNGKKGGTSEVVKYKEESPTRDKKDYHKGTAVYVIKTPRKNADFGTEYIKLEKRYIGLYVNKQEFEKTLKKIDTLNEEIQNKNKQSDTYLQSLMKFFERKAYLNQKKFKLYSKLILIISGISIISLELFHDFGVHISLLLYGVGLLTAFYIYYFFMKKGDVQNNFVYSRGFAEALRVQNAWNISSINKEIADYYLENQHHKYAWIKISLRNMTYIDKMPFIPTYNKNVTLEDWINGQIEYYKIAIMDRDKRYHFWAKTEKFFYAIGLIFLILMFINYFSVMLIETHSHFLEHKLLHILIFSSGVSLLIAALIGEKYNQIEGFEEEIYNFNLMRNLFVDTKEALINVTKGSDEYKEIIYNLGIAALEENSKWVVMHDKHMVKPILE